MKPLIVGVAHIEEYAFDVVDFLEEKIPANAKVGVELIQPIHLQIVELIRNREDPYEVEAGIRETQRQIHLQASPDNIQAEASYAASGLIFWYRVMCYLSKWKAQTFAIDYLDRHLVSRFPRENNKEDLDMIIRSGLDGCEATMRWELMHGPHTDRYMAKRIDELGLDVALVGGGHAQALSRLVDCRLHQMHPIPADYLERRSILEEAYKLFSPLPSF